MLYYYLEKRRTQRNVANIIDVQKFLNYLQTMVDSNEYETMYEVFRVVPHADRQALGFEVERQDDEHYDYHAYEFWLNGKHYEVDNMSIEEFENLVFPNEEED